MKQLSTFQGQNWLITPAALAVGEHPPASIHDQKFLLVLSGVVEADLQGSSDGQWFHETLSFLPDVGQNPTSGPLNYAIGQYRIPTPPGVVNRDYAVVFSLEQGAPFVSLSSIFDESQAINVGFAVDTWRPAPYASGLDAESHQPISNIFNGVNVDVAVRDKDAWIYRVAYNMTLLGKIAFTSIPLSPDQTVVPDVLEWTDTKRIADTIRAAKLNPSILGPQSNSYAVKQDHDPNSLVPVNTTITVTMQPGLPK